jgi:bacterioferritin
MNQKVIDALNAARRRELTAIIQYMAEHYELEDQGYDKFGDLMKKIAIVEMGHAEKLAERILFLGGVPTYKLEKEAVKGQDIMGMLKVNEQLEAEAISMYNDSARICAEEGDHTSKTIFEDLLKVEEEHIDEFQQMMDHVEKIGAPYIATLTD